MSIIAFDGFDLYGDPDELIDGRWNNHTGGLLSPTWDISFVPGRYGGQALHAETWGGLVKALPNKYNTLTVGCNLRFDGGTDIVFALADSATNFGATEQVTIQILDDGTILLRRGSYIGTIEASSAAGAIPLNTWVSFEFQIIIGTSGHFHVWVDGATVIQGGANTQGASSIYADVVYFSLDWHIFESGTMDIDDLYISNNVDQPPNNAPNYGAWRIEPRYPSGDTAQKDFTPISPPLGQFAPTITATHNTNYGSNALVLQPVTSRVTGLVTNATLYWTASSTTSKTKCVVYTDVSGSPGVPIGVSDEVVGVPIFPPTVTSMAVTYPFSTSPVLLCGRSYWIGFITDSSVHFDEEVLTGSNVYHASNPYVSGAPSNPVMITVADRQVPMTFSTTTNANYVCINEAAADNDGSYVATNVSGEDIYLLPQWLQIPDDVWAVNVVSRAMKTVAGGVYYTHRLESEWTDWHGKPFAPGVQWQYHVDMLEYDPNTGAEWKGKAVNALRLGITAVDTRDVPALIETPGIIPQPLVLP